MTAAAPNRRPAAPGRRPYRAAAALGLLTLVVFPGLGALCAASTGWVALGWVFGAFGAIATAGYAGARGLHRGLAVLLFVLVYASLAASSTATKALVLKARGVSTATVVEEVDAHTSRGSTTYTCRLLGVDGRLPCKGTTRRGDRITALVDPAGFVDPRKPSAVTGAVAETGWAAGLAVASTTLVTAGVLTGRRR